MRLYNTKNPILQKICIEPRLFGGELAHASVFLEGVDSVLELR